MGLFTGDKHEKLFNVLLRACESGNVAKMREAIAAGADVNHKGRPGTPLDVCIDKNFTQGVRILLESKADPNVVTENDRTTGLMRAVRYGYADIVKLLLEHGADVNAARLDGQTALHGAACYGRGDIVKLLLDNGANPAAADNCMNTAADASRYPRISDLIRSKQTPEPCHPVPEGPALGWQLTARDEVSNIVEKPGIGYRLTEIFNFGSGIYTRIAHNLESGAESQSLRFFDEFTDREAIDRAQAALVHLGGETPAGKLGKPSLSTRTQERSP